MRVPRGRDTGVLSADIRDLDPMSSKGTPRCCRGGRPGDQPRPRCLPSRGWTDRTHRLGYPPLPNQTRRSPVTRRVLHVPRHRPRRHHHRPHNGSLTDRQDTPARSRHGRDRTHDCHTSGHCSSRPAGWLVALGPEMPHLWPPLVSRASTDSERAVRHRRRKQPASSCPWAQPRGMGRTSASTTTLSRVMLATAGSEAHGTV